MNFSGIFGLQLFVCAMSTVNLQKKCPEYVYWKKKLSLFKEVAIFSIISFLIGFIGTVKHCFFPAFLVQNQLYGCVNCESAKEMPRIRLFEKSCLNLKRLQFSL